MTGPFSRLLLYFPPAWLVPRHTPDLILLLSVLPPGVTPPASPLYPRSHPSFHPSVSSTNSRNYRCRQDQSIKKGQVLLHNNMQRSCLFCTYCYVLLGQHTHGFLAPLGGRQQVRARARFPPPLAAGAAPRCSARRCSGPCLLRLAATPPGNGGNGGAAAAEEGARGGNFGLEGTTRITRAPLRITPNIQPHHKRRPKTDVIRDLASNRAFLTDGSFDMFGRYFVSKPSTFFSFSLSVGRYTASV